MSPKEQKNTLFVRNLSPATLKSDLDSHFGGLGPLRHTIVVTEPGTEKCKGFGFVTFAFEDDAQHALKILNGSCIRGRKISLDVAKKRERRGENDLETSGSREKRSKTPVKREGAKKGSIAMRTVLLTTAKKDGQLTEEEAKEAVHAERADAGFEECVLSANSRAARCIFSSWALAGKAAASAHGSKYDAVIEALQGGKRTTVIVRNLPFLIDENELKSRFQSIAPLRNLRLAPSRVLRTADGKKGATANSKMAKKHATFAENESENKADSSSGSGRTRCGGFAFVEYFLVADAKYAITKLNGIKHGGRVIAVDLAVEKNAYEAQEKDDESGKESDAEGDEAKVENADDDADTDKHEEQGEKSAVNISRNDQENTDDDSIGKPNQRTAASTDEELSRTVFVRNLLFETSASELWKAMEDEFGKVEQAVLVTHPVTKRPRGTAFVRFALVSSAKRAIERAGEGAGQKRDQENEEEMDLDSKGSGFAIHGRELLISNAVDKSRARDFESSIKKRKDDDPRNIRLAWVGMIKPDSQEGKALSKEDLARRAKAVKEKKVKLERNPNVYVSEVRLSIRNLPKDCDEKLLKHMFLCAAQENAKTASSKEKQLNTKQEASLPQSKYGKGEGRAQEARIVHVAIARDPERKERSKGYGFVQYENHEDALRALMFINNNPKLMEWLIKKKPKALKIDVHRERLLRKQWGDGRRLMVEFALEDTRKVRIIEKIKERGRALAEEHKRKRSREMESEPSGKQKKPRFKNANHSNQALSKSERRAALKRERANLANRKHKKTSKNMSTQVKQSESQRDDVPLPRGNPPERRQTGVQQSVREAQRPDPKPKKPKKKRKAAEIEEENKFDRILLSYKQKLGKSGTMVAHHEQNEIQNSADTRPRWFE